MSITPSCTIGASLPTITLGNSSILTWSSSSAVSASLTGVGSVGLDSSQNETPNTTSAYTLTVTSSTGTTATCSVTVTVVGSGDTTPPSFSLTAPSNGATVSGAAVPFSATASDNVAVADVQFKLGNTNIGSAIFSSPYSTTWNTTGTTTPDGSYTLSAVAADTSGNLATSSVTVTVRNAPPVISSIATSTSYTSATTTWTTDEAANSKVVYGLTTGYGSASSSASLVTSHSIVLSGLTASSTYHFAVVSTDVVGNTSTSSDQTFTTGAGAAPNISSISSGSPSNSAATITWTTDQSSNSEVVYGATTSYGSASSSASLVTSHSIGLSGLSAATTHHYAVVSTNSNNQTSTSSDLTFTTATNPPVISNISSGTPTTTAATITWNTDQSSNSEVVYGLTTAYGSASSSASLVTSHSIVISALATSTTYHYAVVSTNGNNQTSTSTDQTFTTASGGGGLPPGVTLQQIDGGSNYYADNGFANAANAGWDSPSFFPIGVWDEALGSQSQANIWNALGWNTAFYNGGITASLLYPTNPIYFIDDVQGGDTLSLSAPSGTLLGIETYDEPTSYANGVSTPLSTMPNATQNARFWWVNNTWDFIEYGPPTGTPAPSTQPTFLNSLVTTPSGSTRHIDIQSADIYWFSGVEPGNQYGGTPYQGGLLYGLGGSIGSPGMTVDQTARAAHYGDMVDRLRAYQTGSYPAPIFQLVETGQPNNFSPSSGTAAEYYITPPQLNAAVWSSIIHGARGIIYFDHTFDPANVSDGNIYSSYYTTIQSSLTNWGPLGGPNETISIYNQVAATDAFVKQMAPVINSPFAIGYATVSPSGWTYGQANTTLTGFDVMAKYYNGQFYIFAQPRYSQTLTNQTATFTLADTNATSVTVVNENRSIPVSGGVFTDTFADGNTIHIYEVNDGASPTVNVTAPSSGATVGGTSVALTATASEAGGTIANVQFKVDGTNIGSAITSSPYTTTWNSTGVSDGSHTLYAVAEDTSGNYATSSISVTVENTPVSISSISSSTPTTTSATITWTTNENASSTVAYGITIGYGLASSSVSFVTSHSIILSGLTASTTYHFLVQATNAAGNYATSSDQTFTTAISTNPPVISNISSASPGVSTSTITWTTDQNSSSEVVYGTTTSYGSASSTASLVSSHSISLTGLATSTTYHFAVVSTNSGGQTSTSTDQTITTANSAPVISAISSGSPGQTTATVTWTTDKNSNSEVVYGLTTSYGSASSSATLLTSHSISLSGLSSNTTYHYAVVSADSLGTTATSSDQTFTTASSSSAIALNWSLQEQTASFFPPEIASWNIGSTNAAGSCGTFTSGNLLIAVETVWTNGGGDPGTLSVPTGWSLLWTNLKSDTRTAVFYKIATGSESCSFPSSWTTTATDAAWALMDFSYTGTAPGSPIDASSSQGYSSGTGNMVAPSASPTNSNDYLLGVFTEGSGAFTPYTQPSGMTTLLNTVGGTYPDFGDTRRLQNALFVRQHRNRDSDIQRHVQIHGQRPCRAEINKNADRKCDDLRPSPCMRLCRRSFGATGILRGGSRLSRSGIRPACRAAKLSAQMPGCSWHLNVV